MFALLPLALGVFAAAPFHIPANIPRPQVVDARLKLECVVAEPDLVTPTGIAVDDKGRVLVIESHTHFRPKDYAGPLHDRIRRFEDTDGDGKLDKASTFFEGTDATMSLAVYRDRSIFVATRSEIFRLWDKNDDGVAEKRVRVVRLETACNHPHNGLAGFTFDFDGNVYFSLGENEGAAYKLIGADEGETIIGGGEGGSIFRVGPDGKELRRIATGFWNPFHLTFDAFGRVFAVDNDPDARGPCRLLHIVEGGDYGFKSRHGRKGVHPFTSWNGELPGTLPMICGTGEAPCAVLAYESDNLPEDYVGDLLVTSWGDHRIERYKLERHRASFVSTMKPVVIGGDQFRPIGMALAPDGSLYFSDWVDKSYQLHGKGRIWRLSNPAAKRVIRPTDPWKMVASAHGPVRERSIARVLQREQDALDRWGWRLMLPDDEPLQLEKLQASKLSPSIRAHLVRIAIRGLGRLADASKWGLNDEQDSRVWAVAMVEAPQAKVFSIKGYARTIDPLLIATAIRSRSEDVSVPDPWLASDPFVIQAAAQARLENIYGADPKLVKTLEATLHSRSAALVDALTSPLESIPRLLSSDDPRVNLVAVRRIGEERLERFRGELNQRFHARPANRELYSAYLTALEMLDGGPGESADRLADEMLLRRLTSPETLPEMRPFLLRMISPAYPALKTETLVAFAGDADRALRIEAVRTLRERAGADRDAALAKIADDERAEPRLRAEAVMGLDAKDKAGRALLERLADTAPTAVAVEALRNLEDIDPQTVPVWLKRNDDPPAKDALLSELWQRAIGKYEHVRWDEKLQADLVAHVGDPEAGERVFFHPRIGICVRCHQHSGRGGHVGPDLTDVAGMTREEILASFVAPNREIPPQYRAWAVTRTDGRSFSGLLASVELNGDQIYIDLTSKRQRVKPEEIEDRKLSRDSLMPEGLRRLMTKEELRDLLAFLTLGAKK